jgi:hypothetical protein
LKPPVQEKSQSGFAKAIEKAVEKKEEVLV